MSRILDAIGRLWPARAVDAKASAVGPLIAWEPLGQPVWAPRDYAAFAREGFMQNAIVYRSVRMISEAAASVPLLLYEGDNEIQSIRSSISSRILRPTRRRPTFWRPGTASCWSPATRMWKRWA